MIKHIVFFKIKEGVEGRSQAASLTKAKEMASAMNGKIPGMVNIEIGSDFSATEASVDMVLYSEFESREALQNYVSHPIHLELLTYLKTIISERTLVDYEI